MNHQARLRPAFVQETSQHRIAALLFGVLLSVLSSISLSILLVPLSWMTVRAQSPEISLFDIDTRDFPTITAKFLAIDGAGNQVGNIGTGQMLINEALVIGANFPRRIVSIEGCPPRSIGMMNREVSLALSFDISGSMRRTIPTPAGAITYNDAAVRLARRLVNDLAATDEAAVQVCNDRPLIRSPFIAADDAGKQRTIQAFPPSAGGDNEFVRHLYVGSSSLYGLAVSASKPNKVAVLFTDAFWYAFTAEQLAEAKRLYESAGIRFFAVLIGPRLENIVPSEREPIANTLRALAAATGGRVFENVQTLNELDDILISLQRLIRSEIRYTPCTISWLSEQSCETNPVRVELTSTDARLSGALGVAKYSIPAARIQRVEVTGTPAFQGFAGSQTITLRASSGELRNVRISRVPNAGARPELFSVEPSTIAVLRSDSSVRVRVNFTPPGGSLSDFSSALFRVEADGASCESLLSARNNVGPPVVPPAPAPPTPSGIARTPRSVIAFRPTVTPSLRLTHPNGREMFQVGSDTVITWTGIAANDVVTLDYSIDRGRTWTILSTTATGLRHAWSNVPAPPSDSCLMRVTQMLPSTTGARSEPITIKYGTDGGFVHSAVFDPLSIYIAVSGKKTNGTLSTNIYDSFDGSQATVGMGGSALEQTTSEAKRFSWTAIGIDRAGERIYVSASGENLFFWRRNSPEHNTPVEGHNERINTVDMTKSPGVAFFVTASDDSTAKRYTLAGALTPDSKIQYRLEHTYRGHQGAVKSAMLSGGAEAFVVTASADGWVKIWQRASGQLADSIPRGRRNAAPYTFAVFNPANDDLVAVAHSNVAELWNWRLGRLIKTFRGHRGQVNTVSFNPSGTALVTASNDGTAKLWDTSGVELATLRAHTQQVNTAMFSPDGTAIVTASSDGTAIVWTSESIGVAGVLQSDVSDTLWRIVQPRVVAVDVVMDTVAVGLGRDKIVTGVIRNTGSVSITLTGLQFRGAQAAEFRLPGGALGTLVLAPGASQTLELTFAPRGTGERQAQMLIFSHRDTIKTPAGIIPTIRGWGEELLVRAFDTVFAGTPVGAVAIIRSATLIRNVGSIPVTIDSIRIDSPDERPVFSLPTNPIPSIAPGNAPSFDIAFAPARVGPANTVVVFYFRRPSGARDSALSYIYGIGLESLTRLVGTAPAVELSCTTTTTGSLQLRNTGAGRIINVQLADPRPISERIVQVQGAVPREFSAQSTATLALSVNMAANPLATSDSLRFLYRVAADVTDSVLIVPVPLRYTARQVAFSRAQITLQTFTANQPVPDTVQVLNTGTEPLDWSSVLRLPLLLAGSTTSSVGNRAGGIVLDSIVPAITPVGGRSTLFVRFTGSALGRELSGTFSPQAVAFADLCSSQTLTVRATTIPPYPVVDVTTSSAIARCETETQVQIRAELRNAGADVLTVDSVRIVGRDASEFTIVDVVRGNFEAAGRPSNAQTFLIRWRPGQPGEKDVRLQVFSNAQNPPRTAPNRSVPIEIPLSAFKHRVAFTLVQTSPQITDAPLGVQQEGRFLLTNTGTLPLTFPPDGVLSTRGALVSIAIRPAQLLPQQVATITLRGSFPAPAEEYVVGYSLTEDTCGVTLPFQWRVRTLTRGSRLELNGGRSLADTLVVRCETGTSSVYVPLVNVGRGVIDGMGSAVLRVRPLSQAMQALLPPSFSFWYNNRPFTAANFPNGISIAAGERDSLELRFTPVGAPPYRTITPVMLDVQHDYPPSSFPLSIVGRVETSGLQLSAASLQFVNYPNQPPQPLRLTNTGSLPIENFAVRFSRLGNVFQTMTEMPNSSTFAPNTTRTVNVRFAAVENFAGQIVRDTALVMDACGTVTRIPLVALPPSATVQLQSAQARPGDTVKMPLLLTERMVVPANANIPLVLSYNASLLLPMLDNSVASVPTGSVAGGVRTVRLDNVRVTSQDETQPLAMLTFRAALGNAPSTAMQLSIDPALTAWITLNVTSGTVFALRGLSHADGTRLVNATTAVLTNITVQPLPAQSHDNVVTVEYESSQASPVTVLLTTLFGEAVSPQPPMSFDPPMQAVVGRKNTVTIDVRSLPAGVYFVNIRSPLQVVSRRLVIVR